MRFILDLLIPGRGDASLDFKLKGQLPYLALTISAIFLIYVLILPVTYMSNGVDLFLASLALCLVMLAVAMLCLRAARYRAAAYITTVSLLGASYAALFLMPYLGNNVQEAYRAAAFATVMAAVNVVVALETAQIWLFLLLYVPAWGLAFATIFRHYFAEGAVKVAAVLVAGIVAFACENIMLMLIRALSQKMLRTAEEQTGKANASFERVSRLLAGAREGMDIGSRIIEAARTAEGAVERVSGMQEYLGAESGKLLSETDVLGRASRSVMDSTDRMEVGLQSQHSAITETSAALVQISQNIASVNKVASQRRGMLDEAVKAGHAQKELIKQLGGSFLSVKESSDGINQFIDTVQDIASRTALLSMNASIEAARAGSAGKGFAVVAQEIRALSGETQRNADLIKEMVGKNGKTVSETGELVGEFSSFIERNVSDTLLLINSIDEILNGVAEMQTGTSEMMDAVKQIVSGTQLSQDMVKDVVSQISVQQSGFERLAVFAKELNGRIEGLREAVKDIRSSTDLLSETGRLNIEQVKKLQLVD